MRHAGAAVSAGVAVQALLAAPTWAVDPSYPSATTRVVSGAVSRDVVQPGQTVVFTGHGFAPRTPIRLSAEGITSAVLRADAAGAVVAVLRPAGAPGEKALAATGVDPTGQPRIVAVTVRLVDEQPPATPPSDRDHSGTSWALTGSFGMVAVLAFLRVLLHSRRFRRPAATA